MADLEFHEAANIFPLIKGERFSDLVKSITANGIREPITLCDGKIIDGRNRYLAWKEATKDGAEIELKRRGFQGGDPYQWVWDLNGERRDLSQDQRYLIWKDANEKSQLWQAEQNRIQQEANQKRSEAAKEGRVGRASVKLKEAGEFEIRPYEAGEFSSPTSCGNTENESEDKNKTATAKAAASHTNRGSVERMDRLARERPDLANQVKAGEMKSAEALRQMKKDQVRASAVALPSSKYRVIYADPPWKYGDSRTNLGTATGAEHHYPTMSITELCDLDVKDIADENAVLFLWATSPLLEDSFKVINAWGFSYKSSFIWNKVAHNMGHYNSVRHELLLIATRGSCTPDSSKLHNSVVEIEKTRKHSEKPEYFRELIDEMYAYGKRIELFRRGDAPAGWDVWGNEAQAA